MIWSNCRTKNCMHVPCQQNCMQFSHQIKLHAIFMPQNLFLENCMQFLLHSVSAPGSRPETTVFTLPGHQFSRLLCLQSIENKQVTASRLNRSLQHLEAFLPWTEKKMKKHKIIFNSFVPNRLQLFLHGNFTLLLMKP